MVKMRLFSIMALVFCSCTFQVFGQSTAEFDREIHRIIDKLKQYPGRTKDLGALATAYREAVAVDQAHIRELLKSGQPDIWPDLYGTYRKMENRQQDILSLPESTWKNAGIEMMDLSDPLAESKYKAGSYYYAHAQKLLSTGEPSDARLAYEELFQLARIYDQYKEMDKLIRKAVVTGATSMEFELQNRTGRVISNQMVSQLETIVVDFMRASRAQVPDKEVSTGSLAFRMRIVLDQIQIGSDQIRELEYAEERDRLENNQVVDTLKCTVREYRQLKKATLTGAIEYLDLQRDQVINRVPVSVESVFINAYAYLQGDPQAAGETTRALLNSRKVEYPSDEQMTRDVTGEFVKKSREVILGL